MKRTIAMLSACMMLLSAVPVPVQAAGSHEPELQAILGKILTESMTDSEKAEAITKYVGETYSYDANGHTFEYALQNGGGDCWATADMVVRLANLAGLRAAYHDSSRDPAPPFYGSQHISAQILADGNYFIADTGFSNNSSTRYYMTSLGKEPYRIQKNDDGTAAVRSYAGFDTEVIVPEKNGEQTVTKIGNWAFQQWQLHGVNAQYFAYLKWEFIKPETVSLPDTVTEIGKGAFYQNDLSRIYLPASLVSVGESSFFECANLTDVYYAGTEEQWRSVSIAEGNTSLNDAVIHFQASGIPKTATGDVNADGVLDTADVVVLSAA